MAVFTNAELAGGKHGIFQSSLLKATISGHIWDVQTQDKDGNDIDVDNGVAVKVGAFTHDQGGLQARYATIAAAGDKIGVTGSVAIVKEAYTDAQAEETNFTNKAGQLAKVYEVVGDEFDPDIFGIGSYQVTEGAENVKLDAYVTVDGKGGWKVTATKPADTYGFIGQIHSIQTGSFYTLIRVAAIKNEQIA